MNNDNFFEEERRNENYTGSGNTNYSNNYNMNQPQYSQNINNANDDTQKVLAILSLIFGIISIVFFCSCCNTLFGIPALVLGIIYLSSKSSNKANKGLAIAGVICAGIAIIFSLVLSIGMFSSPEILEQFDEIFSETYEFNMDGGDLNINSLEEQMDETL